MARRSAKESGATAASATTTSAPPAAPAKASSKAASKAAATAPASSNAFVNTAETVWSYYLKTTPQRTKLLDAFMAFLVVAGGLQFVYCVLVSNYPYNAFLSGFSATVGQFVLTASLRIQTTEANKADFPSVSPERAFADYVVCSLILHFFVINFIN